MASLYPAASPSSCPAIGSRRPAPNTTMTTPVAVKTPATFPTAVHRRAPICSVSTTSSQSRQAARTVDDLRGDTAHLKTSKQASFDVQGYAAPVSLDDYMLLPVEQYFVLDPSQIRHLGGNRFLLLVPRIKIFNVWLEPEVEISVTTQPATSGNTARVILKAENCRIKGSDLIENWRLDQRFCLRFITELTWQGPTTATANGNGHSNGHIDLQQASQQLLSAGSSNQDQGAALASSSNGQASSSSPSKQPAGRLAGWMASMRGGNAAQQQSAQHAEGGLAPLGPGRIQGNASVDVWCEVIPPFNLMPREALQGTCNVVLSGLMSSLLPLFLRQLGTDYGKWATQPAYRQERAQRSKPLEHVAAPPAPEPVVSAAAGKRQ